jgi:C1A family cysteine protease
MPKTVNRVGEIFKPSIMLKTQKKQTPKHAFGWLPDLPDARDVCYSAPRSVMKKLAAKIDLRSACPPVYDQGQLGSCTAFSLGGAFQFGQKKQKISNWIPSRLFIYYNERVLINTVNSDSGAYIRDGIKTMNREGVCAETNWPYDISKFTQKPPAACYTKALTNQVLSYMRVDNRSLYQMQSCLAEGYPITFGFTVYDSFRSIGKNGMMPMPKPSEQVLGGHAVLAVGYDNAKQVFIVRNSWGSTWGDKGYFYMPYAYITDTNRCDDFWTIRLVEAGVKLKNNYK